MSHLNSSSNLTKFQKISRKYVNSLWIRPSFTIIPFNSLLIPQICKFRIIFDTRPCEIDDLAVSSRHGPAWAFATCPRHMCLTWACVALPRGLVCRVASARVLRATSASPVRPCAPRQPRGPMDKTPLFTIL